MKIIRFVILCLSILLFISCNLKRGEGEGTAVEEKSAMVGSSDLTVSEAPEVKEDFDQFLQSFSKEEAFQLKRIKFPLKAIVPDTDHEGMAPMEEAIGKYEWEPLDLTYDSTFLTRTYDQYYQVVRFNGDTAVVEIRGINNGIYADYYFSLIDNRWYLVTIYEASF